MPTPQPDTSVPNAAGLAATDRHHFAPSWLIDLSVGLLLSLCLCLLSCQKSCNSGQVSPQSYSCGSNAGGGPFCNATVAYASGVPEGAGQFFPKIFGFRTTVAVPSTINAGDGRIGNSLVLSSGSTNSFIEVGYYAINISQSLACPTGGGLIYWAQEVDATGTLIIDCLKPVPQGDVGQNIVLEVSATGTDLTKSNSFKVSISAPTQTIDVCDPAFNIRCSTTLWSPGNGPFATATIGQTLVGSSGAAASTVAFVHNSYEVSDGVFAFERGESMVTVQNPPFGGVVQAAAQGTQGGTFYTECCLPPSTVFPAQLDFGTAPVNTAAQTQKIVISNIQPSSGNLNITNIAITGANASEFSQTNNCGSSLAPLASCTVTITFKPAQQGSRTATLTVSDSGGSGSGTDESTLVGIGG